MVKKHLANWLAVLFQRIGGQIDPFGPIDASPRAVQLGILEQAVFGFQHTEIHQRTDVILDIVQHLLPSVEFDEEDKVVEWLDGFDAWYH